MAHVHDLVEDCIPDADPVQEASPDLAIPPEVRRTRRVPPFWRHFLQMFVAMGVGMFITGFILVSIVGLKSFAEVTGRYPTQALLAMAVGMTVPMVAWMLFRGMGWRNSFEMAGAMILPVIPFLCLIWFNVTKSAQCGAYCMATIVAMLALMRHRQSEYSMQM